MKKNGFSLVEVLAALVILAVIAVMTRPLLAGNIASSRKKSFTVAVENLMTALKVEQADQEFIEKSYTFPLASDTDLDIKGETSNWKGFVKITLEGQVALRISNGSWCAKKSVGETEVRIVDTLIENCNISDSSDITGPVITVLGHTEDFHLDVEAGNFAIPIAKVEDDSGEFLTATVTHNVNSHREGDYAIHYEAEDSSGNHSELTLSITLTDNLGPNVEVTGNANYFTNQDVTLKIDANDPGVGLHDTPYSFDDGSTWVSNPEKTFSTNQTVEIVVRDKVLNETERTVVINKIDKALPDVEFRVTSGTAGTNGWYTSNVNVSVTPVAGSAALTDYSYCVTTAERCEPDILASNLSPITLTLNKESGTNKICALVHAESGQLNTVCSNNYKIDKTSPVINVDGHTSAYSYSITSATTYNLPTGSATDNLTSTNNMTVNVSSSLRPQYVGTYPVTYSTEDEAGNTASLVATITVNPIELTLNNQSATSAGTTTVYYQAGLATYYSNSACTSALSNNKITVPTRTGYTFGGYYTNTGGSGTQYINASGEFVNNPHTAVVASRTLYAKWTINNYYVDLNGWLDGASSETLGSHGTCDIYINDALVQSEATDYHTQYPYGTSYEFRNCVANTGYIYVGVHSGSASGTVGVGGVTFVPEFKVGITWSCPTGRTPNYAYGGYSTSRYGSYQSSCTSRTGYNSECGSNYACSYEEDACRYDDSVFCHITSGPHYNDETDVYYYCGSYEDFTGYKYCTSYSCPNSISSYSYTFGDYQVAKYGDYQDQCVSRQN